MTASVPLRVPAPEAMPAAGAAPKISFVSLGCPKALVDSERILTQLRAEGYELSRRRTTAPTSSSSTPAASSISAKAESLDAIGEALAENGKVIVTGCLGAEPEQIRERYPERARDHRAAGLRERGRRGARGGAAGARSRSSTWCRRRASS